MNAFREFTAYSLRQKTLNEQFKLKASPLRAQLQQIKGEIENYMILNNLSTAYIKTPTHNPNVTYVQRVQKVQSRRICRDTIIDGIEYFFEHNDIARLPSSEDKSNRLWECINNARKIDKMVLSILDKPVTKRGQTVGQYMHDASKELADLALQYWALTRSTKQLQQAKKEKGQSIKEKIEEHSPSIMQAMQTKKRKRQRINIQHHNTPCTFYIKVKVSERRPVLKKENIYKIIMESVHLTSEQESLTNRILESFDAIPPVRSERVTLDKGHYLPNKMGTSTVVTEGEASVVTEGEASVVADGEVSVVADGEASVGTDGKRPTV